MTIPDTLNPFPSPAPRSDKLVDPFVVRGNDNLLVGRVNDLIGVATDQADSITTLGDDLADLQDIALSNTQLLQLLAYAFQRIWLLEQYLGAEYAAGDLWRPDSLSLFTNNSSLPDETDEWTST